MMCESTPASCRRRRRSNVVRAGSRAILWIGAELCTAWTHTCFAGFTHAFRSETVCDARKRCVVLGERGHESAPTANGGGADVGNYFLRPGASAPALKPSAPGLACGGGGVDSSCFGAVASAAGVSVAGASTGAASAWGSAGCSGSVAGSVAGAA